jgi:hypothetical protein
MDCFLTDHLSIISRIPPEQFQDAFIRWMKATFKRTDGELIAIDGKTLSSSYDRDIRQFTIHMVSAFAAHNRLVLGLAMEPNYSLYSM